MADFCGPPLHAIGERNRAVDLSEWPQCKSQIAHRADAGVEAEAKGEIIVTARLKRFEGLCEVIPRLAISSRKPAGDSSDAMRDGDLGRILSPLDLVEEGLSVSPHRREFAAHVAAEPQAVDGRQFLGCILVVSGRLASSGESLGCFRR